MKDLTGLERLVEKLIDNKDRPKQTIELYIGDKSLKEHLFPNHIANEKAIAYLIESNANLNKKVEYLENLIVVLAEYLDQLDGGDLPGLEHRVVDLTTFLNQARELKNR